MAAALGDSYALDTELGGGGMSRVFLAHETALGRRVVIKVLSPDLAAGVSGDRFRREILLLAKLQHPHIVPVHTVGEAVGLPYFTMPYVEGESLRTRIARDGELPIAESVRLLRDVASALAYAHAQGIMHRDIKPDNVLLSASSAVVADFGVAKAISDATTTGHVALTSTGMALGTPAYMAPEQAVGDAGMDFRVDIYAFGVMAYEMLSGRAPFQGRSAQATLAAHVTEIPESVQRLRPSVPAALAALVMRCLEKHAADRPASAADILHALDSMATPVSGSTPTLATPLAARSSGAVPTASSPPAMRRALLLLVGTASVGLVVLMLVLLLREGNVPANGGQPAAPLPDSSVTERIAAPPAPAPLDSTPPRAAEPPASRAQRQAGPPPVVRATPDTAITMQLRAAALDARGASRSAGATSAELAAGDSLLKGGDSLRGARRYTEAGMAYSAARAMWAGIVIKPAPTTPTTPAQPPVQAPPAPAPVAAQRQEPRPAIQRRVRDYASAIESESTDRIRQVYPGLTSEQERNWRQFFDAVNDVQATFAISSLTVRGDSAEAMLTGQYAYQNGTTGRAERQPATVSMRLARTAGDEWVVVGIR
ncbi:MAG TPA: protein kinase [Gemmatimonadales bacterium]